MRNPKQQHQSLRGISTIALPHFHHWRNFPSQGNFLNLVGNRQSCHNNNRKTSPQSDKRNSNETKGATYDGDARQKECGGARILRRGQSLRGISTIAQPHFHHRRNFPSQGNFSNLVVNRQSCHNNNNNRKTSPQSDKRKSNETKGATYDGDARQKERGGVRILRRGQSLSCIVAKLNGGDARSVSPPEADDMTVGWMRPERMSLPLLDVYAGLAFFNSQCELF
ncbi:hypothetical protein SASPL_141034 [Salvia splendens]|uniref:Uncharacterized protein n=1 Tax=Salvia splendens TaxID=180675 RepID=A0A8X8ZCH0_SALSN|nr:hypothetical protein SASPL_141034 [Salvia splendens]